MTGILAILTGTVLGPLWGGIAVWLGAMLGATVEFSLARRFGRPVLSRVFAPQRLRAAEQQLGRAEIPLLLTLRLLPVISFNLLNVTLGLATVGRWRFTWTTAVGILPMTAITVGSGAWFGG